MSPDKWQSHWYWGSDGYAYIKNSRCNNGVECFNKQIHAEWLSYRQAPMRRILTVFLATTLSVDSWPESSLEDIIDPDHVKFNSIWRLGRAFIEEDEFMRRIQESLCKHIIACLIEKGLVSIPIQILNRPTASRGLRKPRVRTLGRNGCLRRYSASRTQRVNAGRAGRYFCGGVVTRGSYRAY
jgi:hypothetical protein